MVLDLYTLQKSKNQCNKQLLKEDWWYFARQKTVLPREKLPVKQNANQNCLGDTQVTHTTASHLWEEADSASRAHKSATSTRPMHFWTYLNWTIQDKNPLLNAYAPRGGTQRMWLFFVLAIPDRVIKAIRRSQSAQRIVTIKLSSLHKERRQ